MAEACTIHRAFVVKGGGCKRDGWVITDSELIDGTDFIKLSRLDTGFCRFVAGTSKAMRDMKFLEMLRWMRTQASMELGKPVQDGEALFDAAEAQSTKNEKRHFKQSTKATHERGELSLTCTVTLPQVETDDGATIASREARVRTCLDPKANVAIELKSDVLDHIRALLLKSEQPTSRKRRKSGEATGVRFRPERKGCLAVRQKDGKTAYKTFRVSAEADEIEKAEIAERAQRWVEGEDQEDGSDEGEVEDLEQAEGHNNDVDEANEEPEVEDPELAANPSGQGDAEVEDLEQSEGHNSDVDEGNDIQAEATDSAPTSDLASA